MIIKDEQIQENFKEEINKKMPQDKIEKMAKAITKYYSDIQESK